MLRTPVPALFFDEATMGVHEEVPSSARKRPANYLWRAGAAHVRAFHTRSTPERVAKELFGNDVVTGIVLQRAASTAATTTSPGWAGALAQQVVDDSIIAVASASAAAALFQRGMKIDLDRHLSIRLPGRILDASDAGHWTAEGAPAVLRSQRMRWLYLAAA
jgi:hypothetical protein